MNGNFGALRRVRAFIAGVIDPRQPARSDRDGKNKDECIFSHGL
jgi:hypothetical protein